MREKKGEIVFGNPQLLIALPESDQYYFQIGLICLKKNETKRKINDKTTNDFRAHSLFD